jgi:hypothetical protein
MTTTKKADKEADIEVDDITALVAPQLEAVIEVALRQQSPQPARISVSRSQLLLVLPRESSTWSMRPILRPTNSLTSLAQTSSQP